MQLLRNAYVGWCAAALILGLTAGATCSIAQCVQGCQEVRCFHFQSGVQYPCYYMDEQVCPPNAQPMWTYCPASGTACDQEYDGGFIAYKCTGCDPDCASVPSEASNCHYYDCVYHATYNNTWYCSTPGS